MYYVEENHKPIIDVDTFQKVQDEINRRTKVYGHRENLNLYVFTSKIQCGLCGKKYKRKIAKSGTKYEKPVWMCSTLNNYGKKHFSSSRIPEKITERQYLCY